MATDGTPTRFETDLLGMYADLEAGLNPHVPVPLAQYGRLQRSLHRRGLITHLGGSGPWISAAGRAHLARLSAPPRRSAGHSGTRAPRYVGR